MQMETILKFKSDRYRNFRVTFTLRLSVVCLTLLLFCIGSRPCFAADVEIWDNDTATWTTTLADGSTIDSGADFTAGSNHIAVDTGGILYINSIQKRFSQEHTYLSRYDGTDVRIWDNHTTNWTTALSEGDPIDQGGSDRVVASLMKADADGNVYVASLQIYGVNTHLYLSRYDGADMRIWDNNGADWTTSFADGDPVDTGAYAMVRSPQLAAVASGTVYAA